MSLINRDCREFRSDRPCQPHKLHGQLCADCSYYAPQRENILVLKFDAIGDVMRSTAILHGIRARFPSARVTWFTKDNCRDIFTGNPAVDEVLLLEDPWSEWRLRAQKFDIVYSLDPSPASASIATSVHAENVIGFVVDAMGKTKPATESANRWYEMGLRDDLKRANTQTYFEHLFELADLEFRSDYRPQLVLSDVERATAERTRHAFGLDDGAPVIGLYSGAGGRWRYKRWTVEGYAALADRLVMHNRGHVMLLGGPEDAGMIDEIVARSVHGDALVRPGIQSLRNFFLQVALLDVLVCGDTLALHVATALSRHVVALFGPTSAAEIDLFGRGVKILGKVPCLGCYLADCDVRPTCMDTITVDEVEAAILSASRQGAFVG